MTIVVAVVVLAIVIAQVADDVVNSGRVAGRVEAQTYVSEVLPVVDESTSLASQMHLVRNGSSSLSRPSLESALGDLVEGSADDLTQLASLGVPAPSGRSGRLLAQTLQARERGSSELAGAVALAIGPSPDGHVISLASARMVKAGKDLMTADKDYRAFVISLPRSSGRRSLPASRWVQDPASWAPASATAWLDELSGSAELHVHADLVIVAVTVEPPVVRIDGLPTTTTTPPTTTTTSTSTTTSTTLPGTTSSSSTTSTSTTTTSTSTTTTMQLPPAGSTSVLPPTPRVLVVLVVANAGNAQITGIWAAASVVPQASTGRNGTILGPTRSTAIRIGRLAPGASVVVTLRSLAVSPGRSYALFASTGTGSLPSGPVTASPNGLGETEQVDIRVASG